MTTQRHPWRLKLAVLALLLAACSPAGLQRTEPTPPLTQTGTPVAVRVAATAQPAGPVAMITFGPVLATNAEPAVAQLSTPLPTLPPIATAPGPAPTFGPVLGPNGTSTPTATATPSAPGPLVTFGPVIPPNYTPPPTATLGPTTPTTATITPTPSLTFTPSLSPTPGPILHRDLMGIQIHGYLTDAEWDTMMGYTANLGVRWIKIQLVWKQLEPSKGTFDPLFRAKALNVQRASLRGFRTMISIAKAPDWARPEAVRGQEDGPPDNPQDLADFVAAFVREVKPEFLDAVEIWNEPNLIREWRGRPIQGKEYLRYFDAAYRAIQTVQSQQPSTNRPDHRVTIITAAPAPNGGTADGAAVNDREWLKQLYGAGLAKYGADVAIGAHPYGWGNPPDARCCQPGPGVTGWYDNRIFFFRETLEDYRKIMSDNRHTAARIWVTEFGWATYDGLRRSDGNPAAVANANGRNDSGWQNLINQDQQAEYVLRAFYLVQQPPFYDYMGPMILWNLNFATLLRMTDEGREEAGFSLLNQAGEPRPVFFKVALAKKTND